MSTNKKPFAAEGKLSEAAHTYRDNHHWVPLRLRGKSPDCMGDGWQKRALVDAVPEFKAGENIGVLLGAPSGGLVRLDPDFRSIAAVSQILFPEPTLVFSRKSSPGSGRLYVCQGIETTNFKLPNSLKDDKRLPLHDGKPNLTVFQILSTGAQTMAPPSIHPESGEEVVWVNAKTEPKTLDQGELLCRVGIEAFCMAVRQFWPPRGTRNEAAMALARVLLETFATRIADEEERITVVDELVVAIAMAGGDGRASRDGKERAAATLEKMKAGEEAIGLSRLVELLDLPKGVTKKFRQWLGIAAQLHSAGAGGVSLDDFCAYMPQHFYIFTPTREPWPASSVNSRLPPMPDGTDDKGEEKFISASMWLDRNKPVEQMTWAPGLLMLIRDRLVADGGWIERAGVTSFNLYRPPTIEMGDPKKAGEWIAHIKKVYPGDADHIVKYLAQRVQAPGVKLNHALVLGGLQGIGKDTLLEPVKRAVGPWNFQEVSPQQMLGRFNGFVKSVVLRINEARDLGGVNRYQFYDHTKSYIAAPPDVLRCDEKNLREHSVFNCCAVIITTNHKADGIYLPPDDRRHYVAWSDLTKEDFDDDYWRKLWSWYENDGNKHVAAYLMQLDLTSFDPKAPPPKTTAFWEIVDANRAPEEMELADALDRLKNPRAVTLKQILDHTPDGDFKTWLLDRRHRRQIPHRLESCNYVPVRNDGNKEGRWKIDGTGVAIYAKREVVPVV
jgi:hypothetical protein